MPNQTDRTRPLATRSIPYLFATLFIAQALDLHSTLLGISSKAELNYLIVWLALHLGFTPAIIFVKVIAIITLLVFYRTWNKTSGQLDIQAASCLALLSIISLIVVANNYLS